MFIVTSINTIFTHEIIHPSKAFCLSIFARRLDSSKRSNNTGPGLPNSGLDLAGGQAEAVSTLVPKFDGVRVLGLGDTLDVVETVTGGGVESAARVASGVRVSRLGLDAVVETGGKGGESSLLRRNDAAVVTESKLTPENVLSVGVEVNVEADTLASRQRVDLSLESLVLGTVACSESLVGLVTRVGGSTTGELPLVGPVAVDVSANARVSGNSLTVLAPETVGGLGGRVRLTIGVDNGSDVEVELVDDSLDSSVGGVLGQKLTVLSNDLPWWKSTRERGLCRGRQRQAWNPCLRFPRCEYQSEDDPGKSFQGVAVVGGEPRITWHWQIVSTRFSQLDGGVFGLTRIDGRGLFLSKGSANILNQDGCIGCKLLHLADVLRGNDKVDLLSGTRVENGGSELVDLGKRILSSLGEGDTQALEAIVVNLLGAGNSSGQSQGEKSENERRPHLGNELSIASWRINCAQEMRRSD
ncbi:hypothetical protein HG530_010794 [Fusarium avenaceum]|nr:hypothetical protein HG530_010794 [Fusarium avenaceum]